MMNPRVIAVVPTDDHKLEITFTSGEVGVYDCSPLLEFGVFRELKDIHYFQQASAVGGTVAWPHEQDICPDTLYEDSKKIAGNNAKSVQADQPRVRAPLPTPK